MTFTHAQGADYEVAYEILNRRMATLIGREEAAADPAAADALRAEHRRLLQQRDELKPQDDAGVAAVLALPR